MLNGRFRMDTPNNSNSRIWNFLLFKDKRNFNSRSNRRNKKFNKGI